MANKFPANPPGESCANCLCFGQSNIEGQKVIGYCRAFPPHPHFEKGVAKIGRYATVLGDMWCRSWEPAPSANVVQEDNP